MEKKEDKSRANKPKREDANKETSDLPYDPNINSEDKQALSDRGLSMNQDRDKALSDRKRPVDFTGKDLDIPGREERDTTHQGTDIPDEDNYQFNERGVPQKKVNDGEQPDTGDTIP